MTRRIAVRGIIIKGNTLLAMKFRQDDDGESEHWGTPGGGLDEGESFHEGLHREMIEETGIAPEIGELLFIQQYISELNGKEQLEFFYHIKNTDDYAAVDLGATSHGLLEMTRVEFVDPKVELVKPLFLRDINLAEHVERSKNGGVYVANYLPTKE